MATSLRKIYHSFCLFVFFMAMRASSVFAQNTTPLGDNPDYVYDGVVTIQAIEGIVANILAIAVSGIGFAGFVMLIVGSFKYLLSGGNSQGIEGSKNTMTYAIVGLILALSSWMILNLISEITGVKTILNFSVCFEGDCQTASPNPGGGAAGVGGGPGPVRTQ